MLLTKELNSCTRQQLFFFFLKPSSSILKPGSGPVSVPFGTIVHHDVELAVILGKDLRNQPKDFSPEDALEEIDGYALSIDTIAWNGLPWLIGKGFDTFLPWSEFIPKENIPDPYNVRLYHKVNEETKQDDIASLMIFAIHKILKKGDLIFTGTSKGVGPVKPRDHITASSGDPKNC
ncbi:hypothetical protein METBIDRAFT_86981 [Metschnikowia bicuspidata var. bicuspidata NRRL YB-4993]|uniref:Fumarylacetoacetase-like C-terminal domain-containing protein n=1 Tax=Metschnikowia bicuspidata var. bicuspidata NRRL YB-4993 TaxID=869754 RepID=A0A1A0HER7_9ASCO|nr:hypothetical protein METBIDRAFT_86981 [Metschnikowia bicuspidata var. bicuspidata NRRL YB-4993]OBA22403.1 hypothetical protein METBIDRAFT_86981 [Metschnikowia bicuspidata var. bicuspidata NRRL YB-4993]